MFMKNDFVVKYTKRLYSEGTIIHAVKDYQEICSIVVTEAQDDYVCRFHVSNEDAQRITHEFSNYLIELSCADR